MEQWVSLDYDAFDVFSRFFLLHCQCPFKLEGFLLFIDWFFFHSSGGYLCRFLNQGLWSKNTRLFLGFKPSIVTASRVNDGICDCCDGSDEWAMVAGGACRNNCDELGAAERAERERLEKVVEEGLR